MQTPNLRRRTVYAGMALFAVTLLLFDVLVFSALRIELEANLREVLDNRLEVAAAHAAELPPQEAADTLVALGIPATITGPEDERITADPMFPRAAALPIPRGLTPPIDSLATTLDDGTTVEVFASRSGVETTLQRLLISIVVGTALALGLAYWVLRHLVNEAMMPLAAIATTAEQITRGDRRGRLTPDRPETELGRVANAFDEMLDSLEDAIDLAEDEQERSRRFLADAAHQLRTPITGIRSSVELLLRETEPESRDRLLAHTVRETVRIGRLVSDLLHIARLDQSRPPERIPTDIVSLCATEVRRARDLTPRLDLVMEVPDEEVPSIDIDPAAVSEAIANLVDNARRHASERMTVGVEDRGDAVTILVRDDGPGLVPGSEELVFERFATLDGEGGSGLGLPIARGIARAHGGELSYEDRAFVLRLPRVGSRRAT